MEESKELKKRVSEKKTQIGMAEEKFGLCSISKELYEKFSVKYKGELEVAREELRKNDFDGSNLEKSVDKCLEIA